MNNKLALLVLSVIFVSAVFATTPREFTPATASPNLNHVLLSLNMAGWSGAMEIPTPIQTTSTTNSNSYAPASVISADQLKKINDYMAKKGSDKTLEPVVSEALDTSAFQGKLRALGEKDPPSPDIHIYIPLPDGGMILALKNAKAAYSYRLDANFKLIKSVVVSNSQPHPVDDPEKRAQMEIGFWVFFADNI